MTAVSDPSKKYVQLSDRGARGSDAPSGVRNSLSRPPQAECYAISTDPATQHAVAFTGRPADRVAWDVDDVERLRKLGHTERLAQIGTLAASVAHEINNPAAFILTNLTMMRQSIVSLETGFRLLKKATQTLPASEQAVLTAELTAELRDVDISDHLSELIEMCDDNLYGIKHIAQIVATLRGFAREGRDIGRVDLCAVIRETLPMVAKKVAAHAELLVDLQPIPLFAGESGRLAQVVANLLLNAAQAIEPGAPSHNRVVVSTRIEGEHAILEVQDTGCGMKPEVQERIFEPFFTTKAASEGTGLGLPLCRDIARQHGGVLRCNSTLGTGTSFELVLPIERQS